MRRTFVLWLPILSILCVSCSSDHWVHRFKKEEQFTGDYNTCERELLMKMSEGRAASLYSNVNLDQERIGVCLQQKGWRKVEDK